MVLWDSRKTDYDKNIEVTETIFSTLRTLERAADVAVELVEAVDGRPLRTGRRGVEIDAQTRRVRTRTAVSPVREVDGLSVGPRKRVPFKQQPFAMTIARQRTAENKCSTRKAEFQAADNRSRGQTLEKLEVKVSITLYNMHNCLRAIVCQLQSKTRYVYPQVG